MKKTSTTDEAIDTDSAEYMQSVYMQRVYMCSIEFAVSIVNDQPQKLFRPITDSRILIKIERETWFSHGFFLRQTATPEEQARTSCFLGSKETESDLLQHTWSWKRHELRFIENFAAAQLEIPLPSNVPKEKLRVAKEMFEELILTEGKTWNGIDYKVVMEWPDVLSKGTSFSSNPNVKCYYAGQWERVDAYVKRVFGKDTLAVIFYKINPLRARFYDPGEGKDWLHHYFRSWPSGEDARISKRKKGAGD